MMVEVIDFHQLFMLYSLSLEIITLISVAEIDEEIAPRLGGFAVVAFAIGVSFTFALA